MSEIQTYVLECMGTSNEAPGSQ